METGRKKFHLCDLFPLIQGLTPPVVVTGLATGLQCRGKSWIDASETAALGLFRQSQRNFQDWVA